jgi:hypothetical protein
MGRMADTLITMLPLIAFLGLFGVFALREGGVRPDAWRALLAVLACAAVVGLIIMLQA